MAPWTLVAALLACARRGAVATDAPPAPIAHPAQQGVGYLWGLPQQQPAHPFTIHYNGGAFCGRCGRRG